MSEIVTNAPTKQKRSGSKSGSVNNRQREESPASGEVAVPERTAEVREGEQTCVDGHLRVDSLMAALREANGHLVVANLRLQALAEQMHQLYEEAQRAIQAKDDFFAVISHELRSPLTAIMGWAALLQRNPDTETIAEAGRTIASSASVQARLIDDLLDVSRIMTGKFSITETPLDVSTVIEETTSEMRPAAEAKGVSLRMIVQKPVIISGDAARMSQVIANLLGNAIKFTPAGGLIETRLTREGSFAVIEVSDTGEGIPADFLPYVFDRRSQATDRRFAGLGLGLAIVKHIVDLHRGSAVAASEGRGKGATFTIRIPCAAQTTDPFEFESPDHLSPIARTSNDHSKNTGVQPVMPK